MAGGLTPNSKDLLGHFRSTISGFFFVESFCIFCLWSGLVEENCKSRGEGLMEESAPKIERLSF